MILHDEAYYENRRPIEDLGAFKNCLRFIWDGERRAFLDRTAKDWGKINKYSLIPVNFNEYNFSSRLFSRFCWAVLFVLLWRIILNILPTISNHIKHCREFRSSIYSTH